MTNSKPMNTGQISTGTESVHRHPTTREALRADLLELLRTARREFMLVTPMLDASHWNTSEFTEALAHFIAQHPQTRARMVVEDTEYLLAGCPRRVDLARRFSDRIHILRLGESHHGMNEMFAVADRDSCLVQNDLEQTNATLDLNAPRQTAPWLQRFEAIWNGSESMPGLHGFHP